MTHIDPERTSKETRFLIVDREGVVGTYRKAGGPIAMWALLCCDALQDDLWTPKCFDEETKPNGHNCAGFNFSSTCEECPWDKLRPEGR